MSQAFYTYFDAAKKEIACLAGDFGARIDGFEDELVRALDKALKYFGARDQGKLAKIAFVQIDDAPPKSTATIMSYAAGRLDTLPAEMPESKKEAFQSVAEFRVVPPAPH